MSQYGQSNWSSGVLGFCSRCFLSCSRRREAERQAPARETVCGGPNKYSLVCKRTQPRLSVPGALRSSVCAPAINCGARSSPALQLLWCCMEERGPGAGTAGQEGTTLGLPCQDSLPRHCWRAHGSSPGAERGFVCTHGRLAGEHAVAFLQPPRYGEVWGRGNSRDTKTHFASEFWALSLATPCNRTRRGKRLTVLTR